MKKSLLVVPALGVMLLAAAGSVGGTVAWFSSVSSVEASIGVFQATKIDGNLSVEMTPGFGTEYVDSNHHEQGIRVAQYNAGTQENPSTASNKLTHASYDITMDTPTLYTISSENDTGVRALTASDSTGGGYKAKDHVYYAVTWTMTFTYVFESETAVNLYFNTSSALTGEGPVTTAEHVDAYHGFRIAFVGNSADNGMKRVWSKAQGTNTNVKHVNGSSIATPAESETAEQRATRISNNRAGIAYAVPNVIFGDNDTYHAEGAAVAASTSEATYLGQLTKPGEATNNIYSDTLVFTCVAWFEGTDPTVSAATTDFSALGANLKFYARENATA